MGEEAENRVSSATSAETRPDGAWAVVAAATLGMSVSYVDRQTLAAIAPSVTSALGIDNTQYGWLISAFSFSYLIGAPLAGLVVDRLGARRGFAAAVVVWSLVAGAHGLATSFGALLLLRILLGSAEAPSFPAAAQAIRRAMPGTRRPLAVGLLFTGSSIGAIVAAKLAVRLDAAYGFRAAFAGTALTGALWLPLWLAVTRGGRLEPAPRPTSRAARAATRGSGAREWGAVLSSGPVLRSVIAVVGSAPALMFVLNWTSKYLVDGWHMPKADVGSYLVWPPLLFDVGAVGFGWLASARPDRGVVRTHRDLFLIAMLLSASLAAAPLATSPASAIALCAASACGGGGLYALVTADMLARVPVRHTSFAGGLTAGAQSIAHVVASPLAGWTIDRTQGYAAALVGLGLVVVPTTLLFVAWPRIDPKAAFSSAHEAR